MTDLHKAADDLVTAIANKIDHIACLAHIDHNDAVQDYKERVSADLAALREALAAPVVPEWVAVSEKMPEPGISLLACYTNHLGNTRRIRAFWTPANTTESGGDSDIGVYDEATDTYYDPAGWYECMDNWDEYSAIFVNEGEVTHWMPLPAAPKPKEQTCN